MGFVPFDFDDSVTQTEASRPRVPEGYYLLRANKAEATAEEYEKTPGIIFEFTIMEGAAGVGRSIPEYCALSNKKTSDGRGTQFALGRTLGALGQAALAKALAGQSMSSYARFKQLADGISARIAGKMCVALIADQLVNGRAFSGIEELLPADEWATMKTMSAPQAAPRTASAPAQNGQAQAPAPPVGNLPDELAAMFAAT